MYRGLVTEKGSRWTGKVELIESMLDIPLRRKKPTTYFVNSMSDLFHEKLSFTDILRVHIVMQSAPWHTYQVLTKRAQRAREFYLWWDRTFPGHAPSPYWLGVPVENRKTFAVWNRIELLRQTPAALRFLSLEPLLEDLGTLNLEGIDWVIVGGESGPGARPMHPDWVRSIRDQCQAAGVPFFFKQWGSAFPITVDDSCGAVRNRGGSFWLLPSGQKVSERDFENFGRSHNVDLDYAWKMERASKKLAGCLLDGREWKERPEAMKCSA
jgi:protein gp37